MLNEEIEETEFYQEDFTTASEWEVFISHIEEIITNWQIDDLKETNPPNESIWTIKSEKLMFADVEFEFTSLKKKTDTSQQTCERNESELDKYKIGNSVDSNHEFILYDESLSHTHSCIHLWYGLQNYFVLTTTGNTEINSESKIKILVSSLTIAMNNLKCEIPSFVQIKEKWQQLYLGVHQNDHFRTNFSMAHLRRIPPNCSTLADIIQLFQSKVQISNISHKILCAHQFTYILSDFESCVWKKDSSIAIDNENLEVMSLYRLPFGVTADPIDALKLKVTWSKRSTSTISNRISGTHSNYRVGQWALSIQDAKTPVCLLSDCWKEFVDALEYNSTIQDILNELRLDTLVETKVSTISSILGRAARNSLAGAQKITSAISENILVAILYFLFPDADTKESGPKYPYNMNEPEQDEPSVIIDLRKECKGFKTCPTDSLLWRFCIISATLLHSFGGFRAFAQIWHEFVQEMRYRWEKNIFIPGMTRDLPDLRTCLLHQKLQMLNCCIERKMKREGSPKDMDFDSAEGTSSDEEFFDCPDKPFEESKKTIPTGRLGKFQTLRLIETGEFLYIPITQDPVPKTEDQLDEDADVLLKLGSDAQGSEMRARLMSASLLSDMEAFKAANPGAILEDFVRWYSPRDWTETEEQDQWGQKKGELSKRMLLEDNIWKQTWKSALPVAVCKQKLLFDDNREAEKVLHFLESRTIQQVIELFIPILLHVSIYRVVEELIPFHVELSDDVERLQNLVKISERITRDDNISSRKIESIIQEVAQLELNISKVNSLNFKIQREGDCSDVDKNMIHCLMKGREVEIVKESEIGKFTEKSLSGERLREAREGAEKDIGETNYTSSILPRPVTREYVLSVNAKKPEAYSSTCPQYLRVILSDDGMRLVGAFSEDIRFF